MKGIILASGKGTQLAPATSHIAKSLLPIYDKPMIYYPLATLMSAGIKDILVIVPRKDKAYFKELLGDGKQFGISVKYAIQKNGTSIADALIVGDRFADKDMVALALGDNVFYGEELYEQLVEAMSESEGATIFCKKVQDPEMYVVPEIDANGNLITLEARPESPRSDLAMTGLFVFDKDAGRRMKKLRSKNSDARICDLVMQYQSEGKLKHQILSDSTMWADASTYENILAASNHIHNVEKGGKTVVGCPEEMALNMGFITRKALSNWISRNGPSPYFDYLKRLAACKD